MRFKLHSSIRQTFSSLRNRNFKLFFFGQTISNTGNWLTNVALVLLVLHLTGKGSAIGILAACQFGPILLLSIWGGALADRSDKRKLLFFTQGFEMAESVALAILAFSHNPPVWAFYLISIVGGMLLAVDNPLRRSFVSEMVPKEDLPNAVVLYSTIVNVSRIVGAALAGALIVFAGYGWCFTIDALSYVAVIVGLWMMRPSELHRKPYRPRQKGEIREGIRYVMKVPVLWTTFIMLAIIGSLAYNFTVTLPLFVTRALHGSYGSFTFLYSVFGFGALVGALLVANRRLVKMKHVIAGAASLGVVMLILALVNSVGVALPICFGLGMAGILYMTSTTALVQIESKPEMHGRVLALQGVLLIGTTPIGGPILGWLADLYGARLPIIIGGFACLFAAAFGYFTFLKSKNIFENINEQNLKKI